jgi:signal transduction histidine kinase/CheY-like chemotaxis protein
VTSEIPDDLARAIALGGEMGRRVGDYDWDSHPLGPLSGWPPEFRATVAVALTSRFPIVLWLGADDLFLVYNDTYIPMLGDKHPAALGLPGRKVWWDIWDPIGPMLAGVVATGRATWSDDLMLALVTEGERNERYFTFSYGPIVTGAGDVSGVFCAVNETTERVLGERRLKILNTAAAASMETRTVGDAVRATILACDGDHPDLPFVAVYVFDADGGAGVLRGATRRVAGVLPRSLTELVGSEHSSITASATVVIDDLERIVTRLPSVFGEDCPRNALVMPLTDTASKTVMGCLVVGVNAYHRLDEQYLAFTRLLADQVSAAFTTAHSYDQERQRAEMLAQLDRAKTAFLTNVSHEFRTPLTLLLGPLDDAIRDADQPLQHDRLVLARRNAGRLLRLVNSLLEFSRIEAGRAALSPVPVDVGALTAQIASSFAGLCQRAGLDLVLECRPVIAEIDVGMWETIVLNLMSNAVKFTLTGSITVTVAPDSSGHCRMDVSDTGTGIPSAELERLFERFYRASNTRGRSVEGSGIGLSLVRSLVELHNGTIGINSRVDVGTRVTITIPLGGRESPTAVPLNELPVAGPSADNAYVTEARQWIDGEPEESAALLTTGERSRPLILIADDNSDMRSHLQRILSERWDTIAFADGRTAVDGIREYHPDVVITDVMMPELDGFGLVSALRQDPALASIPVLMLSARAGVEAAGDGFASGVDDYLTKPFSSQDLLNRVEARIGAIARQQASREDDEIRARHDAALADVTAGLASADSVHGTLTALLAAPIGSLGVVAAVVGVVDQATQQVTVHYVETRDGQVRNGDAVAQAVPTPILEVVRTGRPIIIDDLRDSSAQYDMLSGGVSAIGAAATFPLRDSSSIVVGAVALLWPTPRNFSPDEIDLVGDIAGVAGATIARVQAAEREHRIATDFQDHLLDLSHSSGAVVVSAIYQPASEAMRVGGDWYLVSPLDDVGRVAVCVGDVVGHGLEAATVMGRLRAAAAVTALTAPDPRFVLAAVDRYASTLPGATYATLAFAVIDATDRTMTYMCAGHPYPLLVTAAGDVRYLEDGRLPPLTAPARATDTGPGTAAFPAGSLLIMYTDGLIERHDESLSRGFDRLAAAASGCAGLPVDAVCSTLLNQLAPAADHKDDVVVLALRPTGVTDTSFVATVPANLAQLAEVRYRLRKWLAGLEVGAPLEHDILLSVGETLANAIEHGNGLDEQTNVSIEIFARPDTVDATVSDTGRWPAESSATHHEPDRGRGLTLITGLADRLDTNRTPRGTSVHLQFRRPSGGHQPRPSRGPGR